MEEQRVLTTSARQLDELDRAIPFEADFRLRLQANLAASYRLAAVILGDQFDAEDATHNAIERAWRSRRQLRELGRFDAWFQRILVNSCRDQARSRRARPVLLALDERVGDSDDLASAQDGLAHVAERDAIGRALRNIDIDRRIVIALRFYLDLEVDEIARRIGVPSGTVKSRLHRGIRELRMAWEMGK